jgi:hypothetical protein
VIENNIFKNLGSAAILFFNANNIVFRHNVIDGVGYKFGYGEGMYIAKKAVEDRPARPVNNMEIYGNVIRGTVNNFIDLKHESSNADVHHNIFEGHLLKVDRGIGGGADDGLIRMAGTSKNHSFHDNIIRNSKAGVTIMRPTNKNNKIFRNVFYNIHPANFFLVAKDSSGSGTTKIFNNALCNLGSYKVQTQGFKLDDNYGLPGGAPQSACEAEVTRILNEMKSLPGAGSSEPAPKQVPQPPLDLRIEAAIPGGP